MSIKENTPKRFQISDGIIEKEQYNAAPVKVAFLLKEVNDSHAVESWSLTEHLKNIVYGSTPLDRTTWTNVCLWVNLFMDHHLTYQDFLQNESDDKSFNDNLLHKALLQTAIINIKKTGGNGRSNMVDIRQAAENNQEILLQQIEEINPSFLICGGVFQIARSVIFNMAKQDISMLPTGAYYFKYKQMTVLDFCHPAWFTVNKKILFAYAKETIQALSVY